ncbi:MAG: penicillin acylase family protein, partial [Allomuricauda sp.]
RMILDATSLVNPALVSELIKLLDVSHLSDEQLVQVDALRNWDGTYTLDGINPTLYHRCEYYMVKNTFLDELGEEKFKQFLGTHIFKRQIAYGAQMQTGIWWDNVHTKDRVESRDEIVLQSFAEAWQSLVDDFGPDASQWTWDKVHTVEHPHPIGQVESLRSFFNVGPFPVNGTREVINNMNFTYDGTGFHKVNVGPSTRRIVDFSDIDNSMSILPTGQSGNPFSRHYEDQAEMFVDGKFRKMMMNKEEIQNNSPSLLVFHPN